MPVVTVSTLPRLLSTLDGFTIAHGQIGIYLSYGSATIAHNIIKANTNTSSGAGVCASYSSPIIANNWIVANAVLPGLNLASGGGMYISECQGVSRVNNTVVGNIGVPYYGTHGPGAIYVGNCPLGDITNNIVAHNSSGIVIETRTGATAYNNDLYSNLDTGSYLQPGTNGNISADPGFVDASHCDFHITGSGCKNQERVRLSLPDDYHFDGGPAETARST